MKHILKDCPICHKSKIRKIQNRCWSCYVIDSRKQNPLDRMMKHVLKTKSCWLWTAAKTRDGYGQTLLIASGRRIQRAHRAIFYLINGPECLDKWVLHKCDTPLCVNPEHLYIGTVIENGRDKSVRKRIHGDKNPNYRHGKRCQLAGPPKA